MSKVYVIADTHFGHRNICKYRTQFTSPKEHDDFVISNYNSIITKCDTVYFLGDIAFSKEAADRLDTMPGYKILVLGNHDTDRSSEESRYLIDKFDRVYGSLNKKGCWWTHIPIHPEELRGKFNIHGHTHNATLQDPRYVNVSLENCNYFPVDFTEIKAALAAGTIFTKVTNDNT